MRFFQRLSLIIGLTIVLCSSASGKEYSQPDWCYCRLILSDNKVVAKGFRAIDKGVSTRWRSSQCQSVNDSDFMNFKVQSIESGTDIPPFEHGYLMNSGVSSKSCNGYKLTVVYMNMASEDKADAPSSPLINEDSDMEEAEGVCRSAIEGSTVNDRSGSWVVTSAELKSSRKQGKGYYFSYRSRMETTGTRNTQGRVFMCNIEKSNGRWIYKIRI